jgi:hypothetical protein
MMYVIDRYSVDASKTELKTSLRKQGSAILKNLCGLDLIYSQPRSSFRAQPWFHRFLRHRQQSQYLA